MSATESTAVQRLDVNPTDLLVDRNIRLDRMIETASQL
jgi:hypothetical protein